MDECVDILVNYRTHGFPLSSSPAHKPSPSGSVFLYNANTASEWYDDGYRSTEQKKITNSFSFRRNPLHGIPFCFALC